MKPTLASSSLRLLSVCLVFASFTGCAHDAATVGSERRPANVRPIDVVLRGGDADTFTPAPDSITPTTVPQIFDVIVVGGGLAGLSSAVYLTDAGMKVLLVEKESHLGGLAAWSGRHSRAGRGAAYWTDAYEEEQKILDHIGLGDFSQKNAIPEPIDSYYVRGQFYMGLWDRSTVAQLPASFAVFQSELQQADKEHKIPNQPFEEFEKYGGKMDLDRMTAQEWIESMPASFEHRISASGDSTNPSRNDLARFKAEMSAGKLKGRTGMQEVIELMELYCRSALGTTPDRVSAMAFANFYISEIVARYTSDEGTGRAAEKMILALEKRKNFTGIRSAAVSKVISKDSSVEVIYNHEGGSHRARAKYAVFAAQLKTAPVLIQDFKEKAKEQAELIRTLTFTHYSVHLAEVEGHPYRASYDTWVRAEDYSDDDFTDVILGRWMDPSLRGYLGYRDFKNTPPGNAVMTIYQGLPEKFSNSAFGDDVAREIAAKAVDRMESIFSRLPAKLMKGPINVLKVESSRWPLSIHVATPGHYLTKARLLRKPFGRVYFASNNIGTPAFEEALFRGHCAADNILARMSPKFKFEPWTRCPADR